MKDKDPPKEKERTPAEKGSHTGKVSGDIFQHPPTGPIVGEVFKTRADLQKPKSGPVPGLRMPEYDRKA